ncbi:MAG: methyl-accepting chemotaxis protein [bacterium]
MKFVLTIGKKLYLGFGVVIVLMLVMSVVSYLMVNRLMSTQNEIVKDHEYIIFLTEKDLDHLKWVWALSALFTLGRHFEGELDPHKCGFGKWYYEYIGSDEFQNADEGLKKLVLEMEEPHRLLHESAAKIKAFYGDGNKQSALEVFQNETQVHSEKLHDLLGKIRNVEAKDADERQAEGRAVARLVIVIVSVLAVSALVVGLVVAVLITRGITKPVSKVVEVAQKIANGDLTQEADVKSGDEIGELAQTFNNMTANLREMMRRVLEASEQVASASSQIAASANELSQGTSIQSTSVTQTASSVDEMVASIQEVTKSANAMAAAVNQTSSSIEEMITSIEQVAKNAQQASELAQGAGQEVESGNKVILESLEGLKRIRESVGKVQGQIKLLGERSERIGDFLTVISDIAGQTNLLALNAAIEAARAGEHGKGFAVVAEEIRKLAERSAEQTKEIALIVKNIREEMESTIAGVDETNRVANEGLSLGEQVREVLDRIVRATRQSTELTNQIFAATQEQSSGSKQIVEAIENMRTMTDKVANAMAEQSSGSTQILQAVEKMTEMTEQTTSVTNQVASGAEQLSKEADDLRNLVGKFKISSDGGGERETGMQLVAAEDKVPLKKAA